MCPQCDIWKLKRINSYLRRQDRLSQIQGNPEEEGHPRCFRCNDAHPYGHHTRTYVASKKTSLHPDSDQASLVHDAPACRRCKARHRTPRWCGACWMSAEPGEALHCLKHCIQFIRATPEERLKQAKECGCCTICLWTNHDTDTHVQGLKGCKEPGTKGDVWDI